MTTGFEALSDHDVRPGGGGLLGFPRGTDLAENQASGIFQPAHDIRPKIPEQRHRGDPLRDDHFYFGFEKIGRRGGWYEIDAERARCRRAHAIDLAADEFGWLPHHAEEAEAAGRTDGGDELRSCHPAHSGQDHGHLASQELADGSAKCADHGRLLCG